MYNTWTQGINFAFDAGDVLYRNLESYKMGTPAWQIISAKKAFSEIKDGSEDYTDYYPGEVIYRDFEAGGIRTKTQMAFVQMLIGVQ